MGSNSPACLGSRQSKSRRAEFAFLRSCDSSDFGGVRRSPEKGRGLSIRVNTFVKELWRGNLRLVVLAGEAGDTEESPRSPSSRDIAEIGNQALTTEARRNPDIG